MISLAFSYGHFTAPSDCIDAMDLPILAAHEEPSFLQAKFDGLGARQYPQWYQPNSLRTFPRMASPGRRCHMSCIHSPSVQKVRSVSEPRDGDIRPWRSGSIEIIGTSEVEVLSAIYIHLLWSWSKHLAQEMWVTQFPKTQV